MIATGCPGGLASGSQGSAYQLQVTAIPFTYYNLRPKRLLSCSRDRREMALIVLLYLVSPPKLRIEGPELLLYLV